MKLHGKPVYWWVENDKDIEGLQYVHVLMEKDFDWVDEEAVLASLRRDEKELEPYFRWLGDNLVIMPYYRSKDEIHQEQDYLQQVGAKRFVAWHESMTDRVILYEQDLDFLDVLVAKFSSSLVNAYTYVAMVRQQLVDPMEIHPDVSDIRTAFEMVFRPFTPENADHGAIRSVPHDEVISDLIRDDREFAKEYFIQSLYSMEEDGGKEAMMIALRQFMKAYE